MSGVSGVSGKVLMMPVVMVLVSEVEIPEGLKYANRLERFRSKAHSCRTNALRGESNYRSRHRVMLKFSYSITMHSGSPLSSDPDLPS